VEVKKETNLGGTRQFSISLPLRSLRRK